MPMSTLYEVIVGNIGKVGEYKDDEKNARDTFKTYVYISKSNMGRAAGESVDLYMNGEILESFIGSLHEAEMELSYEDAKREMIKGRVFRREGWEYIKLVGYDPARNNLYILYLDGTKKKYVPTDEEKQAIWKYADLNLPE